MYAKEKATITLNKFNNLTVNGGLGLGADKATITADKETTITVNGGTGAYTVSYTHLTLPTKRIV